MYTRSFPEIGCAPGSAGGWISVPCTEGLAFDLTDSCVPGVAQAAIDAYATITTNARAKLGLMPMFTPCGHVAGG
ncbi:hypothetical protein TNCT6_19680 [Streptomyces sp. 6-11-2]|nr:hypothetical protein TNCT6_19680 [Streptomyces sp. 6-11-2]